MRHADHPDVDAVLSCLSVVRRSVRACAPTVWKELLPTSSTAMHYSNVLNLGRVSRFASACSNPSTAGGSRPVVWGWG